MLKNKCSFKLESSRELKSQMSGVDSKDTDALFRSKFFSEAVHLAHQYETREEAKKRSKARKKCVRELWKLGEYWLFVLRSLLWFLFFLVACSFALMIMGMTPNPVCDFTLPFPKDVNVYTSVVIKGYEVWSPVLTFFLYPNFLIFNRCLWFVYNIGLAAMELQILLFSLISIIIDPSFDVTKGTSFFNNATVCSELYDGLFKNTLFNFLTQGPLNF